MSKKDKKKSGVSSTKTLRRVIGLALPHKRLFFFTVILSLLSAPVGLLRPALVQKAVDAYIMHHDGQGLLVASLQLLGAILLEAMLVYTLAYTTSLLGQQIIRDFRRRLFGHINNQNMTYFDTTPIGSISTRVVNDIETVNSVFSQGVIALAADIVSFIVVLTYMLFISWQLTLVCLISLPFLLLATYFFKEGVKKSFEVVRTQVSAMNTYLQERISGMRIIQIFGAEAVEMERFESINDKYSKANITANFHYALFFPIVEILYAVSLGLMVWYGTNGVLEGTVTVGTLIAFPIYLNMLFRPMRVIADKFNTIQMGLIAAQRVFDVLDTDSALPDKGTIEVKRLNGQLEFKDVYFRYGKTDEVKDWVLKGINFTLPAKQTLALVGSTGSGKTSITSLVNRLYDIQQGEILLDGQNINAYKIKPLRQRIAVVLQDVFLFSGSIFENITLRNPDITLEAVQKAAEVIGAHDFISKLPGTYDYQVMERGAALSMGQRQLISFVRALVSDPDILILDEATSSIDAESESIIQNAIIKLIDQRTSIIVAHRLSSIKHAHQIIVMEHGVIAEQGSPQELLSKENGLFKRLNELQIESD
jgi:ATP-binding cassette subfamily B protein